MNICISGWYFHRPLLETIAAAAYPALIVGHRDHETYGLEMVRTPEGRGLDFGCYQQYLMEHWDGVSDVLFMQDDGEVTREALDEAEALCIKDQIDQAFIFQNEVEEYVNAGMSGRAFWCRANFLKSWKDSGGFPVDWGNVGNTEGRQANYGVGEFHRRNQGNSRANWIAIIPDFAMGRRGWISNKAWQYKRFSQGGIVTPEVTLQ